MEKDSKKQSGFFFNYKFIFALLAVVLIILAVEGFFYWKLRKSEGQFFADKYKSLKSRVKTTPALSPAETTSGLPQSEESTQTAERKQYLDGPRFLEEYQGKKELLVIRGKVLQISDEEITVEREGQTASVKKEDFEQVILTTGDMFSDDYQKTEVKFDILQVGDTVEANFINHRFFIIR